MTWFYLVTQKADDFVFRQANTSTEIVYINISGIHKYIHFYYWKVYLSIYKKIHIWNCSIKQKFQMFKMEELSPAFMVHLKKRPQPL